MSKRVYWKVFFRDRLGWTLLYFGSLLLILLYVYVSSTYPSYRFTMIEVIYLVLLLVVLYMLYSSYSFIKWFPVFRDWQKRYNQNSLEYFVGGNLKGSKEQQFFQQLLAKQARRFFAAKELYAEKNRLHLDFVNAWVHQMKSPVAALSLELQQNQSAGNKQWIRSMEEEIEKLESGLDVALSMARLSDFALDYQLMPLSLIDEWRQVLTAHKKLLIRSRVFPKLIADEESTWMVLSDRKWHRFILEQVLQNAVKYATQVHEQSELHIVLVSTKEHIVCRVIDQGPGIPAHDLRRVFDPFFTGENGRKYAYATGMGLYLVDQLCQAMNHQVEIQSQLGKGTTVILTYDKWMDS